MNAGETKPGSSESELCSAWVEEDLGPKTVAIELLLMEREFRSSSDMARDTGIGRGE